MRPEVRAVSLIYVREKKLLIVRSWGQAHYKTPGGKVEPGESRVQALKREVLEELSVRMVAKTISRLGTFEALNRKGKLVQSTAYMAEIVGTPTASREIEKLVWHGRDCRDEISPITRQIVDRLKERNIL